MSRFVCATVLAIALCGGVLYAAPVTRAACYHLPRGYNYTVTQVQRVTKAVTYTVTKTYTTRARYRPHRL